MSEQIFMKFAISYNMEKLKGKYRATHTKFNELITITGVTWDSVTGMAFATNSIWDDLFKRDKVFKTFKKKGCKNFPLLSAVFSSSSVTGAFHNASTSGPVTSDDERRIESDYLMGGDDIEDINDLDGSAHRSGDKRKKADILEKSFDVGMRQVKKSTRKSKMDSFFDEFTSLSEARKETLVMQQKKLQISACSYITDESLEKCMDILNTMIDDIGMLAYLAAIKHFENPHYKRAFLLMRDDARKCWVLSLDN